MKVVLLIAGFCLSLGSCAQPSGASQGRLIGVWETAERTTELGRAKFRLAVDARTVEYSFVSSEAESEVMSTSALYSVKGSELVSGALNKGEPVRFTIAGETLTFDDGSGDPPLVFTRVPQDRTDH
jgi:hypothetical protein